MKTLFTALLIGLSAFGLTACGDGGGLMDATVRAMASDEQLARYDRVVQTLREDDVEALEAMLADGYPEEFAKNAVEYFPNGQPIAVKFQSFNTSTNFTTSGRTRSEEMSAIITMERGDYRVGVIFVARGDEDLKLARLVVNPLFDESPNDEAVETGSEAQMLERETTEGE